jgi:hypothetical protein
VRAVFLAPETGKPCNILRARSNTLVRAFDFHLANSNLKLLQDTPEMDEKLKNSCVEPSTFVDAGLESAATPAAVIAATSAVAVAAAAAVAAVPAAVAVRAEIPAAEPPVTLSEMWNVIEGSMNTPLPLHMKRLLELEGCGNFISLK